MRPSSNELALDITSREISARGIVGRRVKNAAGRKGTITDAHGDDVIVIWDRGLRSGEVIGETVTLTGHREVREACGCAYVERLDGTPTRRTMPLRRCQGHIEALTDARAPGAIPAVAS